MPALQRAVIPLFSRRHAGGIGERDRTVLHEWAHLGLHEYLAGLRIPRWFDEGYAQRASGGWRISEAWRLRLALAGSAAPPPSIPSPSTGRGAGGRRDSPISSPALPSPTSLTVPVDRGLPVFLARWREMGDFEEAFRQTFGYSTGAFETRWAEHVRRRYSWIALASESAVFWVIVGAALIVLARARARPADPRAREAPGLPRPPPRPAYWADAGRTPHPGRRPGSVGGRAAAKPPPAPGGRSDHGGEWSLVMVSPSPAALQPALINPVLIG